MVFFLELTNSELSALQFLYWFFFISANTPEEHMERKRRAEINWQTANSDSSSMNMRNTKTILLVTKSFAKEKEIHLAMSILRNT